VELAVRTRHRRLPYALVIVAFGADSTPIHHNRSIGVRPASGVGRRAPEAVHSRGLELPVRDSLGPRSRRRNVE
jgi:hypothetical protein